LTVYDYYEKSPLAVEVNLVKQPGL